MASWNLSNAEQKCDKDVEQNKKPEMNGKTQKIAKILKIVKKKIVNKIKLYLIRSKQKPTQSLYSLERDK